MNKFTTRLNTLNAWLNYIETIHSSSIEMGLERISYVREILGIEFNCPVFIVGGTNGKSSTCIFLETILLAAGYRTGCYISPHFTKFNERARINGIVIDDITLLEQFEAVEIARATKTKNISLTYFEFTTLAIMRWFQFNDLEAIIVEVGLGGRLDATNIFDADCSIVTNVDIDHVQYLGNTINSIGSEKAAIFRTGRPAIIGDKEPPKTLLEYAERIGANIFLSGRDFNFDVLSNDMPPNWCYRGIHGSYSEFGYPLLSGKNQLKNFSVALAALESLNEHFLLKPYHLHFSLSKANLIGRFQVLPNLRPLVILDVAHNSAAAAVLAQNLREMGFFSNTYAVFGAMADKDIDSIIKKLKDEVNQWHICDLPTERAELAQNILDRVNSISSSIKNNARTYGSPVLAYKDALKRAGEKDRIVVFGSFYTVSGILETLNLGLINFKS